MATEISPVEAERFVAATEQLKKLVLRLKALRMRHARLEQAFRNTADAAAGPSIGRSTLKRLQRLDVVLGRVEQRRDAALAATAALVTVLGKQPGRRGHHPAAARTKQRARVNARRCASWSGSTAL